MCRVVDASHNQIVSVAKFPWSLHTIDLIDNKIKELPEMNRNLDLLNVSQNCITEFPLFPENLKTLCISHNEFAVVNKPLPRTLETFKAYASKIDTFLSTLPPYLITLDLSDNNLEKIPELPNHIMYVYMSNNSLKELPDIPNSVKYLDVSHNKLTKINQSLFKDNLVLKCEQNFLDDDIDANINEFYESVPDKTEPIEIIEKFPGTGQATGYSSVHGAGYNKHNVYHGTHHNKNLDKGVDYSGYQGSNETVYRRGYAFDDSAERDNDWGRHGPWKGGGYGYGRGHYVHNYHGKNYWVNNNFQRNAAYDFRSQRAKITNPHYVSQLFSNEHVTV
jgi:hypothetical protein